MKNDTTSNKIDFQTAASLYSLGKLSINEAREIALAFEMHQAASGKSESASPRPTEEPGLNASNEDFKELRGPSLVPLAKCSIMALAQGLTRESVDPVKDIFDVRIFISAISELLSESEWERASIFVSLGADQAQLWDRDRDFVSSDAEELRRRIREAAIEYINNPLNKDPEP